jgi:allophanate hydrolase
MTAHPTLEVLAPGAYASVQDRGRLHLRRIGVPWAGVLAPRLMRIANALVGNAGGAPVIECFDGGLQLAARGGAVRLGVAGDAVLAVEHAGEQRSVQPWRSLTLADGEVLRVRRVDGGRLLVVAVEGLVLPAVLGSASTYARAALGGLNGRALAAGARLPAAAPSRRPEQMLASPPDSQTGPIRVVAGPQADHFSDATLQAFVQADYRITADADRMGVRLQGPPLAHLGAPEIVSDATVPGSIQVPGNGQPIVLLADAQTAGGYPKLATVVSADLPRLAHARPGQVVRFALVSADEAEQLARAAEAETRALLACVLPWLEGGVDTAALYQTNLVSGMVHAMSVENRPQTSPALGRS